MRGAANPLYRFQGGLRANTSSRRLPGSQAHRESRGQWRSPAVCGSSQPDRGKVILRVELPDHRVQMPYVRGDGRKPDPQRVGFPGKLGAGLG